MCLDNLAKFKVKNNIGYVVRVKKYSEKGIYHSLFNNIGAEQRIGIEMKAEQSEIRCYFTEDTYKSGWHIFLDKKDAIKYRSAKNEKVFKVQFRKILAKGKQYSSSRFHDSTFRDVVVAKYIKLLNEVRCPKLGG